MMESLVLVNICEQLNIEQEFYLKSITDTLLLPTKNLKNSESLINFLDVILIELDAHHS